MCPEGSRCLKITDFLDNRHKKVVSLSAFTPAAFTPLEIFLALISVRGWFKPRAIERPERLCHWKIPVTSSGIEPATFHLASTNYATACPHFKIYIVLFSAQFSLTIIISTQLCPCGCDCVIVWVCEYFFWLTPLLINTLFFRKTSTA